MIRIWKLGSLDHGIVPSKEAMDKLEAILKDVKDGKLTDIIWGPDLHVEYVAENVDEFLEMTSDVVNFTDEVELGTN